MSIRATNDAAELSNSLGPGVRSSLEMEPIIAKHREALSHARKVSPTDLNRRLNGLGDKFTDKYVPALELIVASESRGDLAKQVEGQRLLDDWGAWYQEHLEEIRGESQDRPWILFYVGLASYLVMGAMDILAAITLQNFRFHAFRSNDTVHGAAKVVGLASFSLLILEGRFLTALELAGAVGALWLLVQLALLLYFRYAERH